MNYISSCEESSEMVSPTPHFRNYLANGKLMVSSLRTSYGGDKLNNYNPVNLANDVHKFIGFI